MLLSNPISIALVGGESTGKTTLAKELSAAYSSLWIPEFARKYLEGREGFCERSDLDSIALGQVDLESELKENASTIYFTDTDVLTTVVWYELYYDEAPKWMRELALSNMKDFYFVCAPDFDWVRDKMRYAGEHREWMHYRLLEYLRELDIPYQILEGPIENRLERAIEVLGERFPKVKK